MLPCMNKEKGEGSVDSFCEYLNIHKHLWIFCEYLNIELMGRDPQPVFQKNPTFSWPTGLDRKHMSYGEVCFVQYIFSFYK